LNSSSSFLDSSLLFAVVNPYFSFYPLRSSAKTIYTLGADWTSIRVRIYTVLPITIIRVEEKESLKELMAKAKILIDRAIVMT